MKVNITRMLVYIAFSIIVCSCNQEPKDSVIKHSEMLSKTEIKAPNAEPEEHIISTHGDDRIDEYYWMRLSDEQKKAENPDEHTTKVLDYLNAENTYREKMLSHTEGFQTKLYEEIVGRIKQDDSSVPYKYKGYYYLTNYLKGKEHPIYSRRKGELSAADEVMLDANVLSEGFDYYRIAGRSTSPDNQILAYGEDTLSRRIYTIKFKNLDTGEMLPDVLEGTTGSAVWANDNKTLFYTKKDPETLRAFQVYRHHLGTDQKSDKLIYTEEDDTFYSYCYKTKSDQYIVIGSSHTLTNEYRVIDADKPQGSFKLFIPRDREGNHEHSIAHFEDKWYIRTNKNAKNFKLMSTSVANTALANWEDVIPHREEVFLGGMDIFKKYLVLEERIKGIRQLNVKPWDGQSHYIDWPEESFLSYTSINPEFDTDILRVGYQSMTTPNTISDYNMSTKEKTVLKQDEVVGTFSSDDYVSERINAPARDGVQVPISIVYKKGTELNGKAPCLLYAYGSYGNSMDPYFSSARLSLLDRGFVYAIAHIRGGQELGRKWYEDGKLLKKKNTFTDFIDCGEHLVKNGYADENRLFAMGGSAGGLLMGAVVNMRPDLWTGVVAAVPFVDVITTMLDESIPLTTFEFDEWGNPKNKEYYDYMKSYSPYDNVEEKDYPAMLVTTGLFDSQVQYWEPAKWVARLRDKKTDNKPLIMYCNMETGHGGASGRFERHKETAMEYAFLLDLAGLAQNEIKG